jgi:spermidine/putrescine-binding protein
MPIVKTSLRKHRLLNVFCALGMLLSPAAVQAAGDDSCSQMQVYLAIAPNHREDVMAYIAPRLQKDLGVTLVAEAIGSAAMVDRVTAQASAPRVSIVQWDVPIGITACDQGLCDPIDLSKAPNAQHLTDWAYSRDKAGNTTVLTAGAVGVGFLYNADEFAKHKIEPPKSWKDLADAAYAGRLGVTAPQSTMGTAMSPTSTPVSPPPSRSWRGRTPSSPGRRKCRTCSNSAISGSR